MDNSTKITAIFSLAATIITAIISYTQIVSNERVEVTKLEIQQVIENGKLNLERKKTYDSSKIQMGDFIFQKLEMLRNPDKKGMATAMLRFILDEKEFQDLLTYIAQYGDISARPVAKEELRKVDEKSLLNNLWKGTWDFQFIGASKKSYSGIMTIRVSLEGVVNGDFSFEHSNINGTIVGHLSEDGKLLDGKWKNTKGQSGKLQFNIIDSGEMLTFSGAYSMFNNAVDLNSKNKWLGKKVSNL